MTILKYTMFVTAAFTVAAAGDQFNFVTQTYTTEYTFGSAPSKVNFGQNVITNQGPYSTSYLVTCGIQCETLGDAILTPSASAYGFADGEVISDSSVVYPARFPATPTIPVLSFQWDYDPLGPIINQSTGLERFKGQNDAIVGFRLGSDDQARYGWIRLHRDLAAIYPKPTKPSELATPFVPVAATLNPFPKKPIRAGFPPELPVLQTSVLPDVGQGAQLRIQWPDDYAGVRLQRTASLDAPVTWEDVDATGNDVTVPAPADGDVFYRLIYDF